MSDYESGGVLQPSESQARNDTDQPEPVVPAPQPDEPGPEGPGRLTGRLRSGVEPSFYSDVPPLVRAALTSASGEGR